MKLRLVATAVCLSALAIACTVEGGDVAAPETGPGDGDAGASSSEPSMPRDPADGPRADAAPGEEEPGERPDAGPAADAAPPGRPDAGPPPAGAAGLTVTVAGQTYRDPAARFRRSKYVSGPNAGQLSGLSYVSTPIDLLQQRYLVSLDVNGGGTGYLAPGRYPCGASKGSQTPRGGAYVSVIFPSGEGYASEGGCSVEVTSAGPAAGAAWHVTGSVTGTLVRQGAAHVVVGSFDADYEN